MAEMSSLYINLRRNPNWKSELRTNISENSSDLALNSKLQKELFEMYPLIDKEFNKECNQNIKDMVDENIYKYREIINKGLRESSENNLK